MATGTFHTGTCLAKGPAGSRRARVRQQGWLRGQVRSSEPVRLPGLLNKFLLQANPARAPRRVSTTQLMMSAIGGTVANAKAGLNWLFLTRSGRVAYAQQVVSNETRWTSCPTSERSWDRRAGGTSGLYHLN